MLERNFQSKLIKELKELFKGCLVVKMPADYIQGIPDLLILYLNKWAMLECKRSARAKLRPNQKFYISKFNSMSFARIIYPENKKEVLNELIRFFETAKGTKARAA